MGILSSRRYRNVKQSQRHFFNKRNVPNMALATIPHKRWRATSQYPLPVLYHLLHGPLKFLMQWVNCFYTIFHVFWCYKMTFSTLAWAKRCRRFSGGARFRTLYFGSAVLDPALLEMLGFHLLPLTRHPSIY